MRVDRVGVGGGYLTTRCLGARDASAGSLGGAPWQLKRVADGGKRPLLMLNLAREPNQFQRALNGLSATCKLLDYLTLPAA